ncbi:hypothetical protein [Lentzea sp. HUAS12]|uniref:hypothetical protein n=1 Tax=Lentzea sp. HUAS12 TaxID=2951806 RepID=UPI00209F26D2|nr:hypothetical protein [Lentzea sp. HUAS12]USX51391.1 hypothetical protein ND450_39520 [Lentzea sp. HUAS12]
MRSVILLVPALLAGASAAPVGLPDQDRSRLEELAHAYLQRRADKVTDAPPAPGFGVPTTPELAARLAGHEVALGTAKASTRTRYRAAVVRTQAERFHADQTGRVVVARVHEHTELHFAEPGPVPHTAYGLPHLLTFSRSGAGWLLSDVALGHYKHCALLPETQRPSEC